MLPDLFQNCPKAPENIAKVVTKTLDKSSFFAKLLNLQFWSSSFSFFYLTGSFYRPQWTRDASGRQGSLFGLFPIEYKKFHNINWVPLKLAPARVQVHQTNTRHSSFFTPSARPASLFASNVTAFNSYIQMVVLVFFFSRLHINCSKLKHSKRKCSYT